MNFFVLAQMRCLGKCWLTPSALVRFLTEKENRSGLINASNYVCLILNLTPCESFDDSKVLSSGRKICDRLHTWMAFRCEIIKIIVNCQPKVLNLPSMYAFVILEMCWLRESLTTRTWKSSNVMTSFKTYLLSSPQIYGFSLNSRKRNWKKKIIEGHVMRIK